MLCCAALNCELIFALCCDWMFDLYCDWIFVMYRLEPQECQTTVASIGKT